MPAVPKPTDITLHKKSRTLEVAFDSGERFVMPCEYLRVHSPSAEVQGHGPGERVLVAGKRDVDISAIEPVGDRKSTRLNSSHPSISYAVFCLKKKKTK